MSAPRHDPSHAGARTALSWQRSIVLVAATAGVLAKDAISDGRDALGLAVGGALLVVTVGLYLWRGRLQSEDVGDARARGRALEALTAVSLLAGACALAIAVLIAP